MPRRLPVGCSSTSSGRLRSSNGGASLDGYVSGWPGRGLRAQGKNLGRPRAKISDADLVAVSSFSVREAASRLGVSKSFVAKWRLSTRVA